VHWEAIRLGMKGIPRDQLPPVGKVMREGGLHFLSILVIVGMMGVGYSMANTVLIAMVVALVCALLHKKSRGLVTIQNLIGALREGFQDSISLLTSASCAGASPWPWHWELQRVRSPTGWRQARGMRSTCCVRGRHWRRWRSPGAC